MCSLRSPQRPDALEALGAAAVRVAEDSFFAYAEPCATERVAGLLQARPDGESWLWAAVAFTGPFEGVVRVALPRDLAGDLAGAFCGVPAETLDDTQVADFAGELANMVCGLWLTQTHRTDRFALAAPTVTAADADAVAAAAADPDALGVVLNETPVLLALAAGSPVAGS
jgi:chemotaxis phosphatase CheX-like protein